jgi:hypothetical protein
MLTDALEEGSAMELRRLEQVAGPENVKKLEEAIETGSPEAVERALAALDEGIHKAYENGESALLGHDLESAALPGNVPKCGGLKVLVDSEDQLRISASGQTWCAGAGMIIATCVAAAITFTVLFAAVGRDTAGALSFAIGLALTLVCGLVAAHLLLWREHIFVDGYGLRRYCRGLLVTGRGNISRESGTLREFDPERVSTFRRVVWFFTSQTKPPRGDHLVAEDRGVSFNVGTALNQAAVLWLARRTRTIWRRAPLDRDGIAAAAEAREVR